MTTNKVLIVEDDFISAEYLKELLIENDFEVIDSVDNANDALEVCKTKKVDLILMDIMIKGNKSGCELAIELRKYRFNMPIIFLSAYSSSQMIEYALSARAYSYLLKPYRDIEIISTLKMALMSFNRQEPQILKEITLKNGFSIDIINEQIFQYANEIYLSDQPKKLLILLSKNRGNIVSNEQIYHELWDTEQNINTIRSLVHRLKLKLSELDIHNINKKGYVIY